VPAVVSSRAGSTLRMRSARAVPSERWVPLADSLSAASRQSEISFTSEVRDFPMASAGLRAADRQDKHGNCRCAHSKGIADVRKRCKPMLRMLRLQSTMAAARGATVIH